MAQQNQTTALTTHRDGLARALPAIRQALPSTVAKYLTPERLQKIVLSSMSRNALLLSCTPESVLRSVMDAASLGLEPTGGSMGHAYLVPYRNKNLGQMEAQLIVGYRGFIELARRSGQIVSIEAHVVHERDRFTLVYGLSPELSHTPFLGADPGPAIGAYAVAWFRDGGRHVEFMSIPEIDAVRKRSRASEGGPWVTDYEEMAKKTVVRRAAKYWPMTTEITGALDVEARAESGEEPIVDVQVEVLPQADKPSATDRLKKRLQAKPATTTRTLAELETRLKQIDVEAEAAKGNESKLLELSGEAMDINQEIQAMVDPTTGEIGGGQ